MKNILLLTLVLFFLPACGGAQQGTPKVDKLRGSSIDIWATSQGNILPIFFKDAEHYLLGEPGMQYMIRLANRTDARIEAVVSVDGRDVITGQVADYRTNRGYVLLPGEEIAIEGFRVSLDKVAEFEFVPRGDSYASKMGDDSNVGVIGVAVFDEVPPPDPTVSIAGGEGRSAVPQSPLMKNADEDYSAYEAQQGLGTGYGNAVGSQAQVVPFVRQSPDTPVEVQVLYYDDRAGLTEKGIKISDDLVQPTPKTGPSPFPGTAKDQDFAPPPPR
jgi:hypothetical protein